MFTGIVTDVGTVRKAEQRGDLRLEIVTGYDLATVDLGASIACSGVCLTVVDKGDDWFAVDVSAETQSRTAPEMWTEGARLAVPYPLVNFEAVDAEAALVHQLPPAVSIGDRVQADVAER